jgi:hypothetical protein
VALDDLVAHGAAVLPETFDGQEDPENQLDPRKGLPGHQSDSQKSGAVVNDLQDEKSKGDEKDAETKRVHQSFSSLLELIDDFLFPQSRHGHLQIQASGAV